MDFNLIHSIWTVVALAMFVAIAVWAYSGANRKRFNDAANMPLHEDERPASNSRENPNG